MILPLFQVDAFADRPLTGNPAAVCPLETWLDEALMQAVARENNLSETAFYVAEGDGFRIRWFTPAAEVELCGHATLAAAFVVFTFDHPELERVTFDSLSGKLTVLKEGDRLVLDFPALKAAPCPAPEALVRGLGQRPRAVLKAMDYMAVFDREEEILSMAPDMSLLKTLDLRGVIVTAPGREVDFVSRFFAPRYGIDEDPVTGSAHSALTPYWSRVLGKKRLEARQVSARGGDLWCEDRGERVFIAGRASLYLEGRIYL
jgi:PhzF family phenazine biosynthesis protein